MFFSDCHVVKPLQTDPTKSGSSSIQALLGWGWNCGRGIPQGLSQWCKGPCCGVCVKKLRQVAPEAFWHGLDCSTYRWKGDAADAPIVPLQDRPDFQGEDKTHYLLEFTMVYYDLLGMCLPLAECHGMSRHFVACPGTWNCHHPIAVSMVAIRHASPRHQLSLGKKGHFPTPKTSNSRRIQKQDHMERE